MATDADGNPLSVNSPVWYDDGHSPDWVHGTVTGFNATNTVATIHPDGSSTGVSVPLPLTHTNKPPDPPDR